MYFIIKWSSLMIRMRVYNFIHVLYLVSIKFTVEGVTKCESKVELRAILLSCPTKDSGCDDDDPLSQVMAADEAQFIQTNFKNYHLLKEEKERGFPNTVKDCKRKLLITMKVKNVGKIPCDDEYIVVDHVFDPITGGRGRLLTPIVLKLRQEQMIQLYGLQFQRVVNSDPFEEQKKTNKACSADSENSTCGVTTYDGKPMPFSEGFCCSCNPVLNKKRQISDLSYADSFLNRDSKLVHERNNQFAENEALSSKIVNPELVKLKQNEFISKEEKDNEKEESFEFKGLTMLKPPNYLFERDHKIVCGKEDFLKILCKLRDEKNKEMSEVSNYCTNNCNEKLNLISTIKTDTLKKNVQRRDEEVKSFFGSKPEFKATSSRLNTGHVDNFSDRNSHSYTLKNFMMKSGIKSQDQTKREHQLEQINQITRGKRDNVQKLVLSEPKKKLTLDEKLEKFASSVKKLKNRRKRLFELSRDRFHKTKTQCSDKYKRRSSMGASYPGGCYVKMAPPKFFFSNDKYIIHTTGSLQIILNSTCRSNEVEQESTLSVEQNKCTKSAENETQDLERNNIKKLRNNINQESQNYEIIQENSRNLNSRSKIGRTNCKKKKKLQDKLQSDIFKESIISKSGKLRLKNLPERDENKLKICNDNEKQITNTVTENKETEENNEKQIEINGPADDVDYLQKAKNSRLHIKYIRNFFAENDKEKNLSRHKMKNCISTKSRERPKDLPQIVNNYNKAEFESGQRLHKNKLEKYYGDELKKKKQGLCYEVANKNKGITFDEEGEKEDRSHTLNLSNLERKNLRSKQESASSSEMYSTESIENLMQNLRLKKHFGKNNAKLQCPKSRITGNQKKHFHSALEWELKEKHSRSHFPNKNSRQQVGSADFNFDINRKPFPEFVKPHFCLKEDPQMRFHSNSHSEDGINFANKIPILKSRQQPLLLNKTPRKYLILEKDKAIENPRDICFLPNALNSVPRVKGDHAPKNQLGDEFDSRKPQITQKKYQAYLRGRPSKNYYDTVKNYNALRKELAKAKRARQNLLIDPTKKAEVDVLNNMPPRRWNNFKSEKIFRPLSNADRTSENSDLRAAKSKRMVKYNFEPARGLGLKSELDIAVGEHQTLDKDQKIIEKLDNSSFVKKVKTRTCAEQRSKDTANSEKSDNIYVMSDTVWSKNKLSCYKNKSKSFEKEKRKKKSEKDKERLIRSYANAPDYVANNAMKDYKWKRQQSEQSKENPSRIQENSEKDAYAGEYVQDTAHCMRFGDLWYSVYLIKKPVVAQIVGIQLFDKHELCDGTTQWRDLTKGKMIRIGTFLPKAEDELPTISMTFLGGKTKKVPSAIDPDSYLLLIPSHVSDPSKVNYYPQFDGGPEEYLVVESKAISNGVDCNKIGTSFEAFFRQPDRCSKPRGSCFKRQPTDLWREDMEARIRGKRGKYFVENFGTVPNSPIKTYTNFSGEFLALEYYGEYTSTIEIEVKADFNAMVRKGSNAQIPAVYIDGTYPKKTRIILSVLNIGLTSSFFRPRLGDCPPDLDPAWCPLEGPLVTIPPQQRHDFRLDLSGALPSNKIHVTVQVLNQLNKKVASRKIVIKKGDRCICAFHCKCNCIGNSDGRTCHKLALEEYRGAGYIGSFPFRGGAATSATESIRSNLQVIFLTAAYVLFFMGLIKGLLGIFCRRLGIAGVRVIVGPRKICKYYESSLKCCPVLFDECGFPVHPTTCLPVQIVPLWIEVVINFVFFFLYPLRGIWFLLSSLSCCTLGIEMHDECSHQERDAERKRKSAHPLLPQNRQPTTVNFNLTTLNTKQGKAAKNLPYLPYKGEDDPLEEDDTEFVLEEMKRYRKKSALL